MDCSETIDAADELVFKTGENNQPKKRTGLGGEMKNAEEYQDRFQKRYEMEKKQHIKQGAEMDQDNGSIIRTSNKMDKIKAQSREGNIALEVDRPVLPNVSFEDLKRSLIDKIGPEEAKKLEKPQLKFLNMDENEAYDQDTTIMVSFPRSGNTLLRAYLEKIMGLTSGSDCDITKKLNKDLMLMGLAGEGLVDKRVMIVKTHYPERYGKTKFYAERAILLVRNPVDSITSLFNMVCTGSHNRSIHDDDYVNFQQLWSEFIQQDITVWNDFHEFWTNAKIPVHIIRYEDIVNDPEPVLRSLLEFILNVDDLKGSVVEHYLKLAIAETSPQIYKPRQGKANANFDKFNRIQLDFLTEYSYKFLKMFDYYDLFLEKGATKIADLSSLKVDSSNYIKNFNSKTLKMSIHLQNECEEVTSIYINYPALLLRKKSEMYPNGRTSHRFKNQLRRRVTIIDKNKEAVDKKLVKDVTDVDDAEQEVNEKQY